jgi:DNA primase
MSVVDEVKNRLDIVDVVSGYVNLQKAGRNYKALCPFHQERTPSFVVFPDTQTWRCFGACGEGGDIFGFVMRAEGWDFSETLHELAKRAGVDLQPQTPAQIEEQAESERLRDLINEATRYFHTQLLESPAGQIARDYIVQRHLSSETVEAFMLGYAPEDWHQALQHLQLQGFSQDEVVEAGVATRNERGNVYDRFRHRLMIPIRDGRGHTVGFGARALDKDATPKYLNSPQGPLFDKSALLFGLDMARRSVRETETAVIVEGYMDVMQAHQAGFTNVVAQMGTALTETQLRLLDRYASRLVLALDPDAAGMNATMRGLNVARQTLDTDGSVTFDPRGMMRYTGLLDIDIRVVSLPEGQDPDDLIREDPAAWETLIAGAVPVAEYVIQQQTAHLSGTSSYHERERVARELLPILTATENDLQRNVNIQALARRVRIDERTLLQWTQVRQAAETRSLPTIRDQRRLAGHRSRTAPPVNSPPGQSEAQEGFCLWMLLTDPERLFVANRKLRELQGDDSTLATVLAPLSPTDFYRPDYQIIFQELERSLYQDEFQPLEYLYANLPPELADAVAQLASASPLETFEQGLTSMLATELQSILREQARINAQPEPDTGLFVQQVLALRHSRLERESREYYFLQQDDSTDQDYLATIRANTRARQVIAKALQRMRSLARDG